MWSVKGIPYWNLLSWMELFSNIFSFLERFQEISTARMNADCQETGLEFSIDRNTQVESRTKYRVNFSSIRVSISFVSEDHRGFMI